MFCRFARDTDFSGAPACKISFIRTDTKDGNTRYTTGTPNT